MFVSACPKYPGFLVQNHLPKFGDFIIDYNDCNKKNIYIYIYIYIEIKILWLLY